ncbi:MAG: hypothetical protein AAFR93_08750 [Pseudomonadota bacterium]
MLKTLAFTLTVTTLASTAFGQSGLGMTQAELTLSGFHLDTETGTSTGQEAALRADFATSDHHGVQVDFAYGSYAAGDLGHLGGHLYMVPSEDWKYGVFASFADFNEVETNNVTFGFEAIYRASDRLAVEGRFGLGIANPGNLDYVFADGALHYELSDQLSLSGDLSLTEVDELSMSGFAYEVGASLTYRPQNRPFFVTARLGMAGMEGETTLSPAPKASLTAGFTFGGVPKDRSAPRNRLFKRHDPLSVLALFDRY